MTESSERGESMKYRVALFHTYTVDAESAEEAQSAAWRALDEDMVPDLGIGAEVKELVDS